MHVPGLLAKEWVDVGDFARQLHARQIAHFDIGRLPFRNPGQFEVIEAGVDPDPAQIRQSVQLLASRDAGSFRHILREHHPVRGGFNGNAPMHHAMGCHHVDETGRQIPVLKTLACGCHHAICGTSCGLGSICG